VKQQLFFFLLTILLVIGSLKWNTGPDWASYYSFFRDIQYYLDNDIVPFEPGYLLLNTTIAAFTDNYFIFTLIFLLLTIGIKVSFFVKNFRNGLLLILLIYFSYYMADIFAVRQFLAVSITLYCTRYVIERRFFWFLGGCIIAATIHASALLFLFAYWIYPMNRSTRFWVIAIIICLALGVLNVSDFIIRTGLNLVPLGDLIYKKLQNYAEGEGNSGGSPIVAFILGTLKRSLFLPIFLYFKDKVREDVKDSYNGYLNLLLFGNCLYFLFSLSLPVITRISTYYLFYEVFLLTWILLSLKDVKLRFISYAMLILFCAMRLYSFISPYKELYIPYYTIFEKSEVGINR
jgi:hypothetical protein